MRRALPAPALALLLLCGCGGAATPAAESLSVSPASAPASSPEGALSALDSAERAIDRSLGAAGHGAFAQSAGQPSPSFAPPPPPPPPPMVVVAPPPPSPEAPAAPPQPPAARSGAVSKKAAPEEREGPRQETAGGEGCGTACSALASMERAATHLCEMTGPGDGRCASARDRVKNAAARVRAACPACGG